MHSERTQGFTADPDYWKGEVFVYVGRNQNLKYLNLKELSLLYCWILEILYSTPKGCRALLDPVYGRAKCLPMLGSLKT